MNLSLSWSQNPNYRLKHTLPYKLQTEGHSTLLDHHNPSYRLKDTLPYLIITIQATDWRTLYLTWSSQSKLQTEGHSTLLDHHNSNYRLKDTLPYLIITIQTTDWRTLYLTWSSQSKLQTEGHSTLLDHHNSNYRLKDTLPYLIITIQATDWRTLYLTWSSQSKLQTEGHSTLLDHHNPSCRLTDRTSKRVMSTNPSGSGIASRFGWWGNSEICEEYWKNCSKDWGFRWNSRSLGLAFQKKTEPRLNILLETVVGTAALHPIAWKSSNTKDAVFSNRCLNPLQPKLFESWFNLQENWSCLALLNWYKITEFWKLWKKSQNMK